MIQFKVCFGLFRSNLIGEEFMWKSSVNGRIQITFCFIREGFNFFDIFIRQVLFLFVGTRKK